ncbi:unnamed protein product [Rotaria socialis]|uniref:HAT C-terminal dimerisation domain-containing protein n=1 Tax=Rotaria socialis TaxID=392032 RepID=A0A818P0V8_9BILA|nr:unnamed protein product [Rotaria socialis]CAF4361917.1 unnamed protein product [Rotaria socialis]
MADESRDISGNEQLSIVIRVVDPDVKMHIDKSEKSCPFNEYFLGFIKLNEFDAETLTSEIVRFLSCLKIDLNKCIAMCFDGASVMSGKHAGVQALLRQRYIPNAIYVHCYAHKLNLVICDVTKSVPYLAEFYSIINAIYRYFNKSSVNNKTFKKVQQQLKLGENVLNLSSTVKESSFLVFEDCSGLSTTTTKSLDFGKAHTLISAVIDQIVALRNEENFSKIFDQINQFCADNNVDLNVKVKERRLKTTSTRLKNFLVTSTIGEREIIDCECKYRTSIFYPVIDSIILEMRDRFSTTNMDILRAVSSLSPESSTFLELTELKALCLMLQCDTSLLKNEIQVFKPMLNQSKSKNITDLFFETLPFQQAFPNILRLVICSMMIPLSSTTTERTFSKMKLIKTIARNSVSDSRLSDLSLLAIERDIVVDYENIIDAFAAQHKNSRILLK